LEAAAILTLVGALVSTITVYPLLFRLWQKWKAERDCREQMRIKADMQYVRSLLLRLEDPSDRDTLVEARSMIVNMSNSIRPRYRQRLMEGLNQPSAKGQAEYAKKLLGASLED